MSVLSRNPQYIKIIQLSQAEILSPTAAQLANRSSVYQLDVSPYTRYTSNGSKLDITADSAIQTIVNDTYNRAIDRINHIGMDAVRVITVSANYTLLAADLLNPTLVLVNSASPITIFWPANATTNSKAGTEVKVMQYGAGSVTISGAPGVNIRSAGLPTSKGLNSFLYCYKTLVNEIAVHTDLISSGGPSLVTNPTIAGTGITGATMTLTPGTYSPDGTHTRQWRRVNVTTGAITNIGAGALTYVLVIGDEGSGIDCVETVTDTAGLSTQGISNRVVATPAAAKPVNTVAPFFVAGSSSVTGGTLTVNAGTWTNSPTGYKFQRKLNGTNSGGVTNQAGATLAYTLLSTDEGGNISYNVIAYNGSGDTVVSANSPNWSVSGVAPYFTVNPQITYSTTTDGSVLTCGSGTTNVSATITRVWGFLDATGPWTGNINPLQTGTTYTTTTDDIGSQIWCDVTASNAYGSVTSRALGPTITASVPAPPPPPTPPPAGNVAGVRPGVVLTNRSSQWVAQSGDVIRNLKFNGAIASQVLINQNVTGVLIEDCEFTGGTNAAVLNQGTNTTIRFCYFHDANRGIVTDTGRTTSITYCDFYNLIGSSMSSAAIETDNTAGPTVISYNTFRGTYNGDAVSNYSTSRVTMSYNTWDVTITEPSGAAFTIGDSTNNPPNPIIPGRDYYVAHNTIHQTGGVPAGVFGSDGNTILEYNCFAGGIQLRDYPPVAEGGPAPFLGVTVRYNVIDVSVSYIPQVGMGNVAQWDTNIDSTNCALVP
jgi:hypothetical protein